MPFRRLILVVVLATLGIALQACAGRGPPTLALMPAPEAFSEGAFDRSADDRPVGDIPDGGLLYATGRQKSRGNAPGDFYTSERSLVVHIGEAQISVSRPEITWRQARELALLKAPTRDYPIQVSGVTEYGILERSVTPFLDPGPQANSPASATARFTSEVNRRLDRTDQKDVYIYVHGYKVTFDNPVLVAAEMWHFMGYEGVFIAYSWPATPEATAYVGDVDTAMGMARNLRELVHTLETETKAERIHIIGYSAGTRLVGRTLEQMALLNRDRPAGAYRYGSRLENVFLVSSDIDRSVFGAYLADGILDVSRHLIIYASEKDEALRISEAITGHQRLGEALPAESVPPALAELLKSRADRISYIDVSGAPKVESGNGHGYFRGSPWVSSDLMVKLMYRLDPEVRGLVRDPKTGILAFPVDYDRRMQQALSAIKRAGP
ncbi:MAG: alpha/beta hydrolase [Phenylobacterium sp.]|uniref:alpha/beta hydrolase n=1 Tax=Phenylobacterium sp. TaxID=1871053 RepID=UPI0025FE7F79|nr:alpha/beta hydrolase [Phenylobacterium sp.]MCA6226920.1 alpha/beta hydrolase [Phenylobacterium sp.]MCA6232140.1 alpha/beta hydrolase [Phenylobacterium sp.]MCA6234890.1 alpha/beta hydrolase [Phenylobacterium sp.]MCA6249382.1 alpha/beta hydrolase [Phenylobacterium sp.]MCA6252627.1 alpha/beta hydrolase [Phenylobacterium sp.]